MTITTKAKVREAVDAALDSVCHGSQKAAIEHAAAALCIPTEAVYDAMQPDEGWCCQAGENGPHRVCDDCAQPTYA